MRELLTGEGWLTSQEKRRIDRLIALGLLTPAATAALLASFGILLVDRVKPVLLQDRIGEGGQDITIPKLTTLGSIDKTPSRSRGLDDPRATRLGRFLRYVGIDEFPQLWSVARGDMSMVAPDRPRNRLDVDRIRETLSPTDFGEYWYWSTIGPPGFLSEFAVLTHRTEPVVPNDYFHLAECVVESGRNASRQNDLQILKHALTLAIPLAKAGMSSPSRHT